ncbi:MAG: Smr/MutS family protein [Nitrospirota bacterium]
MNKKDFTFHPFEKLKKKIAERERIPTLQPVPITANQQFTQEELFSSAMHGVQEIKEFRIISPENRRQKSTLRNEKKDSEQEVLGILAEIAGGQRPVNLPDTQEYVEWTNPEYQTDVTQQMHEGQFSIQEFLDLHGHTVVEAEDELELFLQDALSRGLRCVKIIHGRGLRSAKGPQIKGAVMRRLSGRYRKNIIAYVTARQCDGGLGALYVLLKKK